MNASRCPVPRYRLLGGAGLALALVLGHAEALGQEAPTAREPAAQPGESDARPAPDAPPADESDPGAKTTAPKLLYAPKHTYPEEALEQRLEAEVPLILTIETDGTVSDVEVVEKVGYGFDEAAQATASGFIFTPAVKAGALIRSRIRFLYSFRLPESEAPDSNAAPADDVAEDVGILSAKLVVADSEAPLVGAKVDLLSQTGESFQATSDASGQWQIELGPGYYQVSIRAEGFENYNVQETVRVGEATEVVYRLSIKSTGLEIVVTGERPPREVTRRTLQRREISRIPGTSGDAIRSIESLPGVARPPGLAGLLIVRGSAPEDTQTFVNGSQVPLIYHFGGLRSVVPTELLDRIDFYPGNFSSRYGRGMGGIVDVGLRRPDTKCLADYGKRSDETGCYHGLAQLDLLDGRALLQGPIGKSEDWSFAIGGRRSWVDVWLKPVLEGLDAGVTTAPVYDDYQLIVDHDPSPDRHLSLRLYGSNDRLELLIRDPASAEPGVLGGNIKFGTSFIRAQALYTEQLTRTVQLRSMFSIGRDQIDFSLAQWRFKLDLIPIVSRTEFGFNVTSGVTVNAGFDFETVPYEVLVRAPEPPRPGETPRGPFTTQQVLQSEDESTAWRPGWYVEAELQPHRRLLVVPGLRLDFARDSGHTDVSPRVSARYTLIGEDTHEYKSWGETSDGESEPSVDDGGSVRRTTLKGGVGYFHQPPQFQETDDVFGTPGLESNRAIHYSVGVEQELTDQVELSVEGFYKDLTNLVSRAPTDSGSFAYGNEGTGAIYGAETLLKYKPDQRFFGWLAYTLSRSERQLTPESETTLFQFDQTHILTILGSYRLGRGWEFGSRFRLVSGSLETPVNQGVAAVYAADAATYVPLLDKPFSRRLPLFHQLDVRIDKTWQFRAWKLKAYLDVLNAYNNAAAEAISYNYNFTQETIQTGLPILPSLGIQGEF